MMTQEVICWSGLCPQNKELHMAEEGGVPEEFSVLVPWGYIRGRVWGPDDGRPVLCLHGWADNCGSFNTLIPLLPKDFRFVCVDLAGHGRSSPRPPGDHYSLVTYTADLRRVTHALQISKFSLIGHSMGAEVAALFSALYPDMVDALVLLDSYGFLPTDTKELSGVLQQGIDQILQFDQKSEEKKRVYTYETAAQRLSAANPTLSERSVHILLERGLVQTEGGFVFSRDLRVNFKNLWRMSWDQSLDLQSRTRASILVLLSEDGFNRTLSEPSQKEFISKLHQSFQERNHSVVSVPGDHHVHLNSPEVVAPFVSDFLRNKTSDDQQHHNKL